VRVRVHKQTQVYIFKQFRFVETEEQNFHIPTYIRCIQAGHMFQLDQTNEKELLSTI
jgi:hypothetical protein